MITEEEEEIKVPSLNLGSDVLKLKQITKIVEEKVEDLAAKPDPVLMSPAPPVIKNTEEDDTPPGSPNPTPTHSRSPSL